MILMVLGRDLLRSAHRISFFFLFLRPVFLFSCLKVRIWCGTHRVLRMDPTRGSGFCRDIILATASCTRSRALLSGRRSTFAKISQNYLIDLHNLKQVSFDFETAASCKKEKSIKVHLRRSHHNKQPPVTSNIRVTHTDITHTKKKTASSPEMSFVCSFADCAKTFTAVSEWRCSVLGVWGCV